MRTVKSSLRLRCLLPKYVLEGRKKGLLGKLNSGKLRLVLFYKFIIQPEHSKMLFSTLQFLKCCSYLKIFFLPFIERWTAILGVGADKHTETEGRDNKYFLSYLFRMSHSLVHFLLLL